jgi:hypothetical protein
VDEVPSEGDGFPVGEGGWHESCNALLEQAELTPSDPIQALETPAQEIA